MVRLGGASQFYDVTAQTVAQNEFVQPLDGAVLPFFNPSYTVLPFIPLSVLQYRTAYIVFWVLEFWAAVRGCLVDAPLLIIRGLNMEVPAICDFLDVSSGRGGAEREGQLSLMLLFLYCCCFVALEKDRQFSAGGPAGVSVYQISDCVSDCIAVPGVATLAVRRGTCLWPDCSRWSFAFWISGRDSFSEFAGLLISSEK